MNFLIKLGEKYQEKKLGIHKYKEGTLDKRQTYIPENSFLQTREIQFFCPNIGNMPLTKEEFDFVLHESLPTSATLDVGNT